MKKLFSLIKNNINMLIVVAISIGLRFINLGYSDYQGDEIKALYLPEVGQNLSNFLVSQKKGPVQFLITYLIKFLDNSYSSQFLVRFPFALAGVLAVIFFYKFVKLHFGERIAFYSSLFFSTSGLFVAFSRIVQYQSFVVLFAVLSLYFLSMAGLSEKYKVKGIFLGLLFWALSILSHYDGVFIAPIAFYLLFSWFKNADLTVKQKISIFLIAGVLSLSLLLIFYLPFMSSFSESTADYWESRITGSSSGKISSSKYIFSLYQPVFSLGLYFVLSFFGSVLIVLGFMSRTILSLKNLPNFVRNFFDHTTDVMVSVQKGRFRIVAIILWVALAVGFFEGYVYIPGTHIYNYLLPTFILMGFGVVLIESAVFKVFEFPLVRIFNFLGIVLIISFLTVQSYVVFVDHKREYPWEDEKFLIWTFRKPDTNFHLSLFGFPYYRNWDGIKNFVMSKPDIVAYYSNERRQIAGFYLDYDRNYDRAGAYVHIMNPQSFTDYIGSDKVAYWISKYDPVYTLTENGRDKVRLYMMEPGTLEEIKQRGF
jgi:hypothetical protein